MSIKTPLCLIEPVSFATPSKPLFITDFFIFKIVLPHLLDKAFTLKNSFALESEFCPKNVTP
jgi:hypothetical protein